MEEEFRVIKGFENYSVSNFGNVKNNQNGKIMKLSCDGNGYYKLNLYNNGLTKTKYVHRLVGESFLDNCKNKNCIDHIDNNPKNNSISNLRYATLQENQFNQKLSKANTSGFKGVRWNNRYKVWMARIKFNKKEIHLGSFQTKDDAIKARFKKAQELFGEYINTCEEIKNEIAEIKDDKKRELEELEALERELEEILK